MKAKKTLLVAATVIFTLVLFSPALCAENVQTTGPYDSLRDYIKALEARGRLLRIKIGRAHV